MTAPTPASQPMPMDRAILWNPVKKEGTGRHSGRAPYPVFFQQEAVVALQDHLKASPQQAIFGFLAGSLFRDPETGVLYAIIDKTLRLNQAIYGDKTEVVVARLWDRMQEQLARASGRVLGWYHSHPGQGLALTTHDVDTHVKFFTEPWQVAVVVAAEAEGGGVIGGFFRSGSSAAWAETPLAFYELLQPESIRADGKKRSFIMWRNYKAFNPVSLKTPPPPPARVAPPPPAPTPPRAYDLPFIRSSVDDEAAPARPRAPVFIPDEPPERAPQPLPPQPPPPRRPSPPPEPPRSAPPREPPRAARRTPAPSFRLLEQKGPPRRRRSRRGFWLALLAFLLIGGGGAAAGYWYFVLRQPGAPLPFGLKSLPFGLGGGGGGGGGPRATPPSTVAAPPPRPAPAPRLDTTFVRLDRLSDTLSSAVRNYHDRATLFARRQIDCAALARGYGAIENLWITYAAERKERIASFDARRAARDQALYASVDSVEGQFEKSHCPRP